MGGAVTPCPWSDAARSVSWVAPNSPNFSFLAAGLRLLAPLRKTPEDLRPSRPSLWPPLPVSIRAPFSHPPPPPRLPVKPSPKMPAPGLHCAPSPFASAWTPQVTGVGSGCPRAPRGSWVLVAEQPQVGTKAVLRRRVGTGTPAPHPTVWGRGHAHVAEHSGESETGVVGVP